MSDAEIGSGLSNAILSANALFRAVFSASAVFRVLMLVFRLTLIFCRFFKLECCIFNQYRLSQNSSFVFTYSNFRCRDGQLALQSCILSRCTLQRACLGLQTVAHLLQFLGSRILHVLQLLALLLGILQLSFLGGETLL